MALNLQSTAYRTKPQNSPVKIGDLVNVVNDLESLNENSSEAPGGGTVVGVQGTGTVGKIAKFTPNGTSIGDSVLSELNNNIGIDNPNPIFKFTIITMTQGDGMFLMNNSTQFLAALQRDVDETVPRGYLGLYDSNGSPLAIIGSKSFTQSDFINTGSNFGIGSIFNLSIGATAKLHVVGNTNDISEYIIKLENIDEDNAFSIKNNGQISSSLMPSFSDNAAALLGGLTVDDWYKTPTGELRIVV